MGHLLLLVWNVCKILSIFFLDYGTDNSNWYFLFLAHSFRWILFPCYSSPWIFDWYVQNVHSHVFNTFEQSNFTFVYVTLKTVTPYANNKIHLKKKSIQWSGRRSGLQKRNFASTSSYFCMKFFKALNPSSLESKGL